MPPKFLIDAQLPRRVALRFREAGYDAVHTLDLPDANRTPDTTILQVAAHEGRIVVTKDADFVDLFVLTRQPKKLLLISTGNISNADLEATLLPNLSAIIMAFAENDFVELNRKILIIHP